MWVFLPMLRLRHRLTTSSRPTPCWRRRSRDCAANTGSKLSVPERIRARGYRSVFTNSPMISMAAKIL